jgi:hypothetical protein
MAVTHWDHHGLKFFYPLAVDALQASDEARLQCPSELAMQAVWLFFARKQASRKLQRLAGRPALPRTLCAVPPTATIDPAPTKLVWDAARADIEISATRFAWEGQAILGADVPYHPKVSFPNVPVRKGTRQEIVVGATGHQSNFS